MIWEGGPQVLQQELQLAACGLEGGGIKLF